MPYIIYETGYYAPQKKKPGWPILLIVGCIGYGAYLDSQKKPAQAPPGLMPPATQVTGCGEKPKINASQTPPTLNHAAPMKEVSRAKH